MRVLVTGPENSGTGAVAELLRQAGADVVHRAIPHVLDWNAAEEFKDEVDRTVVVIRGLYAHVRSLEEHSGALRQHGCGPVRHRGWALDTLWQFPSSVWVTYESLVEPTERRYLCEVLGLDWSSVTSVIEYRNWKRYPPSEGAA
jgi:hypothetical protein